MLLIIFATILLVLSLLGFLLDGSTCSTCGRTRCGTELFSRRMSTVILTVFCALVLLNELFL